MLKKHLPQINVCLVTLNTQNITSQYWFITKFCLNKKPVTNLLFFLQQYVNKYTIPFNIAYDSNYLSDPDSINEIDEENYIFQQNSEEEEEEESQYSNYTRKRRTRQKNYDNSLIDKPFVLPLQHNNFLDMDDNDNDLFPDVNTMTYDSDSIFTKADFSTTDTINDESANNSSSNHKLNSNFLTENAFTPQKMDESIPMRKRKCIKFKKTTNKSKYGKIKEQSLISVDILPERYRCIFNFPTFNKMQSIAFQLIYQTKFNTIISSPTGSGKTVLFELAILNLIINSDETDRMNLKILYIAPTKSLCTEILNKWNSMQLLDLAIGMFTGDTTYKESENIKKSNIIITTPEKWDLLTRKWNDYSKLFHLVKLILVDEIHTIGETRGATLEVILTRMNTLCQNVRFIAASATIPNINDMAEWLKSSDGEPAKMLTFNDEFRQVSLEKHVYGFSFYNNKNEFQKDAYYNTKLCKIILHHYKRKPVLIFCPTRSSTISTAKYLLKHFPTDQLLKPASLNLRINDSALRECVYKGIAFHNAGLSLEDRNTVEQNFRSGNIKILCSTSTLAVGVNLPAYLAVIKGTSIWDVHANKDYSNLDILQMIGRAGRPQFEKEGCAIIITDLNKKVHFENLLDGNDMLESTLNLNMYEHLCSEISLQTIKSPTDAINWLRRTFFYVRYQKNPKYYWQIGKIVNQQKDADSELVAFCAILIKELIEEQLINVTDDKFICSPFGQAMVRHYILFETMKSFIRIKKNLTLDEVLTTLVKSKEFKELRIRQNEKRFYKEINISPLIRFPYLTGKKQGQIIDQTYQKISLLIQYELGGLEFPLFEWSFKIRATVIQDRLLVLKHCQRLLKCMIDTFISKKDGNSLKNALFLLRCINGNTWEDSTGIIRQLKLIGLVAHRKLVNQKILTFQDVANLSEEQLEYYLGLRIGLGNKIKEDLSLLPKLGIRIKPAKYEVVNNTSLNITFKIEISAEYKSVVWHGKYLSVDCESINNKGELLDFRRIFLKQLRSPKSFKLKTMVDSSEFSILFLLNCQEIAGIGKTIKFSYNELDHKYRNILKGNSKFKSLDKCLFVENESSEDLLSDDSILQYLAEEKKLIKVSESNNFEKKTPCNVITPKEDRNTQSHSTKATIENNLLNLEGSTNLRKMLPNGNYECNHFCKDKNQCRHYCCKDGIPIKLLRNIRSSKYFNTESPSITQFSLQSLHAYKYDPNNPGTDNFEISQPPKYHKYEKDTSFHQSSMNVPTIEEIMLDSEEEVKEEKEEEIDEIDSCQDMSKCDSTLLDVSYYLNDNNNRDNINSNNTYNQQSLSNPSSHLVLKDTGTNVVSECSDSCCSDVEKDDTIMHRFFGSDVEIN